MTLAAVVGFVMKIKAAGDENAKAIKAVNEAAINAINRVEASFKERFGEIGKRLDENDKWTDNIRVDVASIKKDLEQLNKMINKIDSIYEILLKGGRA
jgi:hypothetical protein